MTKSRLKLGGPEYQAIHKWLKNNRGLPDHCEECNDECTSTRYEWSNISGQYKWELTDFRMLCVSCHRAYDGDKARPTMCKRGHLLTEDNTRWQTRKHGKGRRTRACIRCMTEYDRKRRGYKPWHVGGPGQPPKHNKSTYGSESV